MEHSLARIRYQRGGGLVKQFRMYADDETLNKRLAAIIASLQAVGIRIIGVERNGREITPQSDRGHRRCCCEAPRSERTRHKPPGWLSHTSIGFGRAPCLSTARLFRLFSRIFDVG